MLWKILFFNIVDNTAYSYARYAVIADQGIPSFDEIKDVLKRKKFTQESDDSDVLVHPVGLGVSIDLDVDGYLPEGYKVVSIDELAEVVLPFAILGRRLAE